MGPHEVIEAYGAAWGAADESSCRSVLEKAWADGGEYCDPMSRVKGRDAMVAHIAGFADRFPGHSIVLTSGVDAHDDFARFGWEMLGPDGGQVAEGVDFATFGSDGRIERIVGFFGPLPGLRG
jgi:hypothetical protein